VGVSFENKTGCYNQSSGDSGILFVIESHEVIKTRKIDENSHKNQQFPTLLLGSIK